MTYPLSVLSMHRDSSFEERLAEHAVSELQALSLSSLQVNLGKRCNQACHHCHVDAGPHRTEEMTRDTVEIVLDVLRRHDFQTLDITGGAPELNPHFRHLAREGRALGKTVIDRSNLTIFFEPGQQDLPQFLAEHRIEVTASLPCYLMENVDRQRGSGVFDKSIQALRMLNTLGYGKPDSGLMLNLVHNPIGLHLPPPQPQLERDYQRELSARGGIIFNRLYTITNMPINRFRRDLQRSGGLSRYMNLLAGAFNPDTLEGLMCRSLVSVGWDGSLYDCDFNQMLEMPLNRGMPGHIREFDYDLLRRRTIRTGSHCLGCTAGAGSSCTGSVVGSATL